MTSSPIPVQQSEETPDGPRTPGAGRAVVQFFLVPLLVVAVCVGVFLLFSLLTFEHKSPADYLSEVRGGAANQRWQAAFELSRAVSLLSTAPSQGALFAAAQSVAAAAVKK